MRLSGLILFVAFVAQKAAAWEDQCKPFSEIYADGTELCEVMWNGAFQVVDDETEVGYTMWFFDADHNPNDETTRELWGQGPPTECHLQYDHKEDGPSPETGNMRECHPWINSACCHSKTVESVQKIREYYGAGFEWDRCGPMSQSCERFFVQEACFYECEPNAGLYRKYPVHHVNETYGNHWQMSNMPIKKSYCDAWFEACRHDYFCGKGDFWECEAHYWADQKKLLQAQERGGGGDDGNKGLKIGLSIVGAVAGLAVILMAFLIHKEKKGEPYFADATKAEDHPVA